MTCIWDNTPAPVWGFNVRRLDWERLMERVRRDRARREADRAERRRFCAGLDRWQSGGRLAVAHPGGAAAGDLGDG